MPPKKSPTKKPAAKKPAAKKPAKKPVARKPAKKTTGKKRPMPEAFKIKLKPDAVLAAVVGAAADTRPQLTKKIWVYIKKHNLQDPANGQYILPDAKLKELFGKSGKVFMTEVPKAIKNHTTTA